MTRISRPVSSLWSVKAEVTIEQTCSQSADVPDPAQPMFGAMDLNFRVFFSAMTDPDVARVSAPITTPSYE